MTFFLDTPLVVQLLGLEGAAKESATSTLVNLLKQLAAKVAVFQHTVIEINRTICGAALYLDRPDGVGGIVTEARRTGKTPSDLRLIAANLENGLKDAGVEVIKTPRHQKESEISVEAFENVMGDSFTHRNPKAKEHDVECVRAIYTLRAGTAPGMLERSIAAFVTSNGAFAKAAYEYGQRFEESQEVSSVITDFSLANMAWLKNPMGAISLPIMEVMSYAYAALQPTQPLMEKFLKEIEKLEESGLVTASQHQLFRSSQFAQDELVRLTLGNDEAITPELVSESLKRVVDEILGEEAKKFQDEEKAHLATQEMLAKELYEKSKVQSALYWKNHGLAVLIADVVAWVITIVLIVAFIGSYFVVNTSYSWLGYVLALEAVSKP
ncbi:hypothetical protein AB1L30_18135 [Bremerella sp. JC817]|uniref:hypothetical protein n=1 Tax=Bremerella sp. JC817 TaxID=3231756 RepID=UPI003459C68D